MTCPGSASNCAPICQNCWVNEVFRVWRWPAGTFSPLPRYVGMRGSKSLDVIVEQCRRERQSLISRLNGLPEEMAPMPRAHGDMNTMVLYDLHEQLKLLERTIAACDRHLH